MPKRLPAVDLSIDFDFFIREEVMWNFGHSEQSGLTGFQWMHRYSNINLWEETHPRTYADFMPYRIIQKLDAKNIRIPKGARIVTADSHQHAFEVFEHSRAARLVNIDAHHDCFSTLNTPLDCGNWVIHLRAGRPLLEVQQVYPKWKDTESERALLAMYAPDILRAAAKWEDWRGLPEPHDARCVFVCFSSAWVPPHHWTAFQSLVQLLSAHAETDPLEIGSFAILKPAYFPQSPIENQALVAGRRAQWEELRIAMAAQRKEAVG